MAISSRSTMIHGAVNGIRGVRARPLSIGWLDAGASPAVRGSEGSTSTRRCWWTFAPLSATEVLVSGGRAESRDWTIIRGKLRLFTNHSKRSTFCGSTWTTKRRWTAKESTLSLSTNDRSFSYILLFKISILFFPFFGSLRLFHSLRKRKNPGHSTHVFH